MARIPKREALAFWHFILASREECFLDPESLAAGRLVFSRDNAAQCGNCGRDIQRGTEGKRDRGKLEGAEIVCACGTRYPIRRDRKILDAER